DRVPPARRSVWSAWRERPPGRRRVEALRVTGPGRVGRARSRTRESERRAGAWFGRPRRRTAGGGAAIRRAQRLPPPAALSAGWFPPRPARGSRASGCASRRGAAQPRRPRPRLRQLVGPIGKSALAKRRAVARAAPAVVSVYER